MFVQLPVHASSDMRSDSALMFTCRFTKTSVGGLIFPENKTGHRIFHLPVFMFTARFIIVSILILGGVAIAIMAKARRV